MKSIYRKSALDKLSSLEQLDKAMKVSTPMSWIALFGITVIIVVTLIWSIKGRLPSTVTAKGVLVSTNTSTNTVFSGEAGTVQAIEGYGHDVYLDTPILELAVDGKNKVYYSDQVGVVSEVLVNAGDTIKYGTEILRIRPKVSAAQEQVAVCYVARGDVDKVDRGMDVHITLTSADSSTYGYMLGRVLNIDEWATTTTGIERAVGFMQAHDEGHGHGRDAGADDDAGQGQGLGNGVDKVARLGKLTLGKNWGGAAGGVADGDDEQVHAVVHDGHADDGLKQIVLGDDGVKAEYDEEKGTDIIKLYHLRSPLSHLPRPASAARWSRRR